MGPFKVLPRTELKRAAGPAQGGARCQCSPMSHSRDVQFAMMDDDCEVRCCSTRNTRRSLVVAAFSSPTCNCAGALGWHDTSGVTWDPLGNPTNCEEATGKSSPSSGPPNALSGSPAEPLCHRPRQRRLRRFSQQSLLWTTTSPRTTGRSS